nr:Glyco_hydro_63 [uncultured bacterium]
MDNFAFSYSYADYGLHTDAVKLVRPKPLPRQQHQNLEMTRKVLKQPEYRLVDTTFGYVNIFPFLLQILDADSPKLSKILTDIRDPDLCGAITASGRWPRLPRCT